MSTLYHVLVVLFLLGGFVYVTSIAQSLNAIAAHNLKFSPEGAAVAAAVAVAADNYEPIQVKIGGETFFARLVHESENKIELAPIKVGDIPDFELAKLALRAS